MHLRRRHRRRAPAEEAQRAQVEPLEVGQRQERTEHRGDRVEVGHALALDRLEDGVRLGLRQDHDRRPGVPDAEGQRPAAHVEHREHAERDVVLAEPELEVRRRRLEPVAPVGEEGSLRRSRGAAGVEHHVRVMLVDGGRHVVGRLRVGQGVETPSDGDEPVHARQTALRPERPDEVRELRRHEERLRLGVADDGRNLGRGEAAVHRDDDRAELDRREVDDRVLGPVRRDDGDPVAAADAQARERAGELVRARMEGAVRHPVGADDVGDLVAADGGVPTQDVSEEQHARRYFSSIRISR